MKKIVLFLLVISLFAIGATAFSFSGYVKDLNGINVASANVTLTEMVMGPGSAQVFSTLADSSGYFTLSVTNESVSNWELKIVNYSSDGVTALLTNKVLPPFPASMYNGTANGALVGETFYLQNATTINITALNNTHSAGQVSFNGFVFDSKYNFPIASFTSTSVTQKLVVVPVGKSNYTVTLFSQGAFYPKTQTFVAQTAPAGTINHTQMNVSFTPIYVSGYLLHANGSFVNQTKGENLTFIRSYFSVGSMIDLTNGYMQGVVDVVDNVSDKIFYNLTILSGSNFLTVFFVNNSATSATYYAGFQNFSLSSSSNNVYNITVYPLPGSYDDTSGLGMNTSKVQFNVYYNNTTALVPAQQTFIQFKVYNYTGYNEFITFTSNTNNSGQIRMFLRNDSAIAVNTGVEVFNQQFPPRKFVYTNAQLAVNAINLTLKGMNAMEDADGAFLSSVRIEFFKSNAACDVAGTPPAGCELFEITNASDQSEGVEVLLSPGDVSIRLTKTTALGDIIVHYINVDMLASGPPDMSSTTSSTASDTGGSLKDVWKFGSMGPSAYESLIIGVPYNSSRIDDINGPTPSFLFNEVYDVQNSWLVLWDSTRDPNANGISANFSNYPNIYTDFDIRWFNASTGGGGGMPCSKTNTSAECYMDTAADTFWLRIPHFSGVGPQLQGYSTLGNITSDEGVYSCWQDSAAAQGCSALINVTVNSTSTWANKLWNISINNTATISGIRYVIEWYNVSSWATLSQNNTFVNGTNLNLSVGTHQFRVNLTLPYATSTVWNFTLIVNQTAGENGGTRYEYNTVWLDSVNLTLPTANNITTNQKPMFNFTLFSHNWTNQSCTLTIGTSRTTYTNSTVNNGTAALLVPTSNLLDGNHTWNITCNVTGISANRWVHINDTAAPGFSVAPAASSITTGGATLSATTDEAANCRYSASSSTGYDSMTSFGSSGGTVHSTSLTALSAGKGYTYYVICRDTSSNTNEGSQASASFTTLSEGGGGGTGGAGGGVSSTVAGQFAKEVWTSIKAGETATVKVVNAEIGVTEVSFAVGKTTYGAWAKVEKLDSLPSTMGSPSSKVYKNIQLLESNIQKVLKDMIIVKFKVAKSWLNEKKVVRENVVLFRYADSKWNELKTTAGQDDGTYVHYTAETPGFSYFVIGEKAGAAPTPKAEVAAPEAKKEAAATTEGAVGEEAEEAAAPAAGKVWIVTIIVAVIMVLAAIYFWKKK